MQNAATVAWSMVAAAWAAVGLAPAQTAPLATVHLVGVQHAPGQLLHAAMSPAHVRRALAAIAPDVVCVESCPEWFAAGHFYRETYEAEVVAVPWARARGLPVHAVDWVGDVASWSEQQRVARVERERADLAAEPAALDPRRFGYGAVHAAPLREVPADAECDFARLNGAAFAQRWNEWLDAGRDQAGSAQQYFATRNARIADAIAAAARAHPGERLVVVIGAAHLGDLERLLPARGLALGATPAVADVAASDADLAVDDLAAIVTHALDHERGLAPPPARLVDLRERLRRAAGSAPGTAAVSIAAYVDARAAMLAGDAAAAARAFAPLVEAGHGVRFPYRGTAWRLHLTVGQAARLELGRLDDLAGRRDSARRHYEALLATLPEPPFDPDYHASFEFAARARNAVRALLHTPFAPALAFASADREAAAAPNARRGAAPAALQRAWELHRARQWAALREAAAAIDRAQLAAAERLELDFHLAAASVALDARTDAVARLDALAASSAGLGAGHWLVRELPRLRAALR